MLTAASLALPILAIDALLLLPNYTASSDAPLRVTVPAVKVRAVGGGQGGKGEGSQCLP